MKRASRHLICVYDKDTQRRTFHPRTELDKQVIGELLASCPEGTIVRDTVEIIGINDLRYSDARAHYFATLKEIVNAAHEDFTESITGKSQSGKVETLDYAMRHQYCAYAGKFQACVNPMTGETINSVFRINDTQRDLNYDELREYTRWVIDTIQAYHNENYGYEIPIRGAE